MTPTDTDTQPATRPALPRPAEVAINAVIGLPIWWAGWQALDALKGWIL